MKTQHIKMCAIKLEQCKEIFIDLNAYIEKW